MECPYGIAAPTAAIRLSQASTSARPDETTSSSINPVTIVRANGARELVHPPHVGLQVLLAQRCACKVAAIIDMATLGAASAFERPKPEGQSSWKGSLRESTVNGAMRS